MPSEQPVNKSDIDSSSTPTGGRFPFPLQRLDVPAAIINEVNGMLDWYAGTLLNGQILGRLGVKAGKRPSIGGGRRANGASARMRNT